MLKAGLCIVVMITEHVCNYVPKRILPGGRGVFLYGKMVGVLVLSFRF